MISVPTYVRVCVISTSAVTDLIIRDVISVYVCCRMLFVMSIAGQ